jgi:hypothetical protein
MRLPWKKKTNIREETFWVQKRTVLLKTNRPGKFSLRLMRSFPGTRNPILPKETLSENYLSSMALII